MNKEKIKEYKEVFDAWLEGAVIQYKYGDMKWTDCAYNNPNWDKGRSYRVKQREPLKFWGNIYNEGNPILHSYKHSAINCKGINCVRTAEFIEVMSDE